jgi:hypothetical protein
MFLLLLLLLSCGQPQDSASLSCPTIVEPCEQMVEMTVDIPAGCGVVSSQVCVADTDDSDTAGKCYDLYLHAGNGTVVYAPLTDGECTIVMDGCRE